MPFITLGAASELQIKVPTNGTTNWGDTLRTDTFQKIAEHDHTGSGKGVQLGAGSLAADSVTGAKLRLDNNESLRARDAADSTNINLLKLNASDKLEIETEIGAALSLGNNIDLQARNNADSSYLSLLKLNTSDQIELGQQIASLRLANNIALQARNAADNANIDLIKADASDNVIITATQLNQTGSVTLTDNTSAATSAGVISLSTDEVATIEYKITRGTSVQRGRLTLDEDNSDIIESFSGDDAGITFSINAGALEYTSTSTGDDATMTFIILKQ